METATIEDKKNRLTSLTNESLGEIYEATIGYNPFEDEKNATAPRSVEEVRQEVIQILQDTYDEQGHDGVVIPNSVFEREGF
jgi:hypothetical protein